MRSARFRLPRPDRRWPKPAGGPLGHLEFVGWLAPGVLWVDGWLTSASHAPLPVAKVIDGRRIESEAQRFCYSRADLGGISGAAGQILVLAAEEIRGDPPIVEALLVRQRGSWYRWTPRGGLGIQPDLVSRFDEKLPILSPEVRLELVEFLIGPCRRRFSLELGSDRLFVRNLAAAGRFLTPEALGGIASAAERLQRELEACVARGEDEERDEDEEPGEEDGAELKGLASYQAEPNRPLGVSIDRLIAVDAESLFVRGWIWDLERNVEALHLVTPAGTRTELLQILSRVERPDVSAIYRPEFGELAEGRHGFVGLVHVGDPTEGHLGYGFELCLRSREKLRAGAPPTIADPFQGRSAVIEALPDERFLDLRLLERHVHPALERLQNRCRQRAEIARAWHFSQPQDCPEISVVVPLSERLDLVEHQILQLAEEPQMANSELIYVVDAPELAATFERQAFQLSRLYQLPLRGIVTSRHLGYASAINLGVRKARGRLLVLMRPEVFGERSGWLATMADFYNSRENLGALGTKLLYEDHSLRHAGFEISRDLEPDGLCSVVSRFQGLPRRYPEAEIPAPVPALSGALLMIRRDLFERLGGMVDEYVAGDLEDVDLCLRCTGTGHANWYLPAAELLHLGRMPELAGQGWQRGPWADLYTRWLLTRRSVPSAGRVTADG